MAGISSKNISLTPKIKPLTPEQRAKQAERFSEIGNKGELFVFEIEKNKLESLGLDTKNYPKHVALESTTYGYDIKSLDESNNEIYIEVKTTTKEKEDLGSKQFYISSNEFSVFEKNKPRYKLYRVYSIENLPNYEIPNLNKIELRADGYICRY